MVLAISKFGIQAYNSIDEVANKEYVIREGHQDHTYSRKIMTTPRMILLPRVKGKEESVSDFLEEMYRDCVNTIIHSESANDVRNKVGHAAVIVPTFNQTLHTCSYTSQDSLGDYSRGIGIEMMNLDGRRADVNMMMPYTIVPTLGKKGPHLRVVS